MHDRISIRKTTGLEIAGLETSGKWKSRSFSYSFCVHVNYPASHNTAVMRVSLLIV